MIAEKMVRLIAENTAEMSLLAEIKKAAHGGQALLSAYHEIHVAESQMVWIWDRLAAKGIIVNDSQTRVPTSLKMVAPDSEAKTTKR